MFWWPPGPMPQVMNDITNLCGGGDNTLFGEWVEWVAMHAGRSIIGRPLQQFAPPETEQCALENILYHCNLRKFQAYCF